MNTIIPKLQLLLTKAMKEGVDLPDELVEEYKEACVAALTKQFSPREQEGFRYRLSAMGKPLCQLQMEKAGADREDPEPFFLMRMLFGDLAEALLILLLKAGGVDIGKQHEKVEWDGIPGELDIIIDDRVYDIKTASQYSYKHKFESYESLKADDSFGYITQLYGYAVAKGIPAGGWIVMDKSSGQVKLIEAPTEGDEETLALHKIAKNKKALEDNIPFKRCFEAEEETFYKKPTGNKTLGFNCSYCAYKKTCWPTLSHEESRVSKAKVKPMKWYVT